MDNKFDMICDSQCTEQFIMIACRRKTSNQIKLLAAGPKQDVFKVTYTGSEEIKERISNGVKWYHYDDGGSTQSWGFASSNDTVSIPTCDGNDGSKRLCWYLKSSKWAGGFRCGDATFLSNGHSRHSEAPKWEKLIFTRHYN